MMLKCFADSFPKSEERIGTVRCSLGASCSDVCLSNKIGVGKMVGPLNGPKNLSLHQRTLYFLVTDSEPAHPKLSLTFPVSLTTTCRKNSTSRTGGSMILQPLQLLRTPPPPRRRFRPQRPKRPQFPPSRKRTVCIQGTLVPSVYVLAFLSVPCWLHIPEFPCFRLRVSFFKRFMS